MSDRFKFRAWDGMHMYYSSVSDLVDEVLTEGEGGSMFALSEYNYRKPEWLMQCTGLKDRNGTLIFEGDILRFPAKDQWEETSFYAMEVFYHDNNAAPMRQVGLCLGRNHFYGNICGCSNMATLIPKWTEQLEIIGNIYEGLHSGENTDILKK